MGWLIALHITVIAGVAGSGAALLLLLGLGLARVVGAADRREEKSGAFSEIASDRGETQT